MSSSPRSTITSSEFDMENAFSTMNIHNYTSASSATSGSTSFNSSEDSMDGMIPPTFSLFYNNPYLKNVQAFYAKESPIPPPDPITPPAILTPSLILPPSLLMPPKRMSTSEAPVLTHATIEKLVAHSVATVLEAQAAIMASTNNPNSKPRKTPVARKCAYKEFTSYQLFYFNGLVTKRYYSFSDTLLSITITVQGNPEILLHDHAVVDSGFSSHMTGQQAYFSDYEDFNGGFVCLELLDKSQVVLRAPRKDGVYSLDLKKICSFWRCDNETEFKNYVMNKLCAKKGIKREFSVARTPQLNGVTERKNRTLIEAAKTMLADSLLPIPFWAEAVNTACYVIMDVGTQDSYVAGSSGNDKGPTQEYILLPLQPHRTRIPVKDIMPEDEQVWQDELEMMITQAVKAAPATSTNQLSTARPFVSTGSSSVSTDRSNTPNVSAASTSTGANANKSSFVYLVGKIPIDATTLPNADLPIDPNMPDLEVVTMDDEGKKEQVTTSIESNKPLVKDEDGEDVDVHVYRSMIGSLMYLTASRPSIMFVVCACARIHFELKAFSDSDYGGASLDRKSTTCGCQFLAANCCGQVLWIQNKMMDYGFNFMNTKIHIDNESTISVIKNPVAHSRTKHIEIRFHFIRDCYEKRLIEVIKIHTDHNVADLLIKGFDVTRFNFLVVSIRLLNL
ncbi:putative ribonuclease H-like domain-containing protein [Tanacetum coccineum]